MRQTAVQYALDVRTEVVVQQRARLIRDVVAARGEQSVRDEPGRVDQGQGGVGAGEAHGSHGCSSRLALASTWRRIPLSAVMSPAETPANIWARDWSMTRITGF